MTDGASSYNSAGTGVDPSERGREPGMGVDRFEWSVFVLAESGIDESGFVDSGVDP